MEELKIIILRVCPSSSQGTPSSFIILYWLYHLHFEDDFHYPIPARHARTSTSLFTLKQQELVYCILDIPNKSKLPNLNKTI
jgi:hypothetical protein